MGPLTDQITRIAVPAADDGVRAARDVRATELGRGFPDDLGEVSGRLAETRAAPVIIGFDSAGYSHQMLRHTGLVRPRVKSCSDVVAAPAASRKVFAVRTTPALSHVLQARRCTRGTHECSKTHLEA